VCITRTLALALTESQPLAAERGDRTELHSRMFAPNDADPAGATRSYRHRGARAGNVGDDPTGECVARSVLRHGYVGVAGIACLSEVPVTVPAALRQK
jgi:hypothetical protein